MSIIDTLKHTALTDRLLRRPPGLYDYARRTIARVSALAPDEPATWSETRLAAILARARSLPGYAQAPASTRLTDWPILSKPQLIGREKLFATRGVLPRAAGATGGTTGQPMQVTRTAAGVVFEQATIDRLCREAGADCALSRVAVLRGDSIKDPADMSPPFWVDEGRRKRLFSAHHLNRESIGAYVKALHDFAPDILFCYPSSLGALLHALPIDAGLHIPVIFASSETLSPATGELAITARRSSGRSGPTWPEGGRIRVRPTIEGTPLSSSTETSASPVPSWVITSAVEKAGLGRNESAAIRTAFCSLGV